MNKECYFWKREFYLKVQFGSTTIAWRVISDRPLSFPSLGSPTFILRVNLIPNASLCIIQQLKIALLSTCQGSWTSQIALRYCVKPLLWLMVKTNNRLSEQLEPDHRIENIYSHIYVLLNKGLVECFVCGFKVNKQCFVHFLFSISNSVSTIIQF